MPHFTTISPDSNSSLISLIIQQERNETTQNAAPELGAHVAAARVIAQRRARERHDTVADRVHAQHGLRGATAGTVRDERGVFGALRAAAVDVQRGQQTLRARVCECEEDKNRHVWQSAPHE